MPQPLIPVRVLLMSVRGVMGVRWLMVCLRGLLVNVRRLLLIERRLMIESSTITIREHRGRSVH